MTATNTAKNNKAPLLKANYVHQAGAYSRDCANKDGSVVACSQADNKTDDFMEVPYYSPSVASHCSGVQCSFASWGTHAHTPTPFASGLLYMSRYRDCGSGVLEYTQLIHNFADADPIDYNDMPWGGVRTSVLQV